MHSTHDELMTHPSSQPPPIMVSYEICVLLLEAGYTGEGVRLSLPAYRNVAAGQAWGGLLWGMS